MKKVKELLFVSITSVVIILGLAFLNILGVKLIYVPLLLLGVAIGILLKKEVEGITSWAVAVVALVGVGTAIMLVGRPSLSQLITVATAFAISVALPFILLELRKMFIERKK